MKYKFAISAFFIILTSLFFYKIILHPSEMIYPASDIFGIEFLWRKLLIDSVKNFHILPLWNEYAFSGKSFIANPLSYMFYPFVVIYFLFPLEQAFGYAAIIYIFLLGLFTFFYARSINISKYGSILSAITYMFSGTIILLIYPGHIFIIGTILWLPVLFFFYERGIQQSKTVFWILAGVVTALIFLAGHTQTSFYILFSGLLYIAIRFLFLDTNKKRKYWKRICFQYLLSIITGVCLSAMQLFPSLEFSFLSGRGGGVSYDFATSFSMHPTQLAAFLFPHIFGNVLDATFWGKGNFWSVCGYLGVFSIMLTIVAIKYNKNKYVVIFTLLALFSLFYSFGKYTPFFTLFYNFPIFNSFRVPVRFLYIYAFSLSVLSGFGIDIVLKNQKKITDFYLYLNIGLLVFSVLLFSLLQIPLFHTLYETFILQQKYMFSVSRTLLISYLQKDILFVLGITTLNIFLFIYFKSKKNLKLYGYILLLIVFFDLWYFSQPYIMTKYPRELHNSSKIVNKISSDNSTFRFFDMTGLVSGDLNIANKQSITGVDPLYIKSYRDFIWSIGEHSNTPYESFISISSIKNRNLLNLLNVKYIVSPKILSTIGLSEIFHTNEPLVKVDASKNTYYLYENTQMLPRVKVFSSIEISNNFKYILTQLNKRQSDYGNTAFASEPPLFKISQKSNKYNDIITDYKQTPNKISLTINTTENNLLMFSEIWYPGWYAYDNKTLTKIIKVDAIFRGVYLKKGQHSIDLIFAPLSYKIGKVVSLLSVMIISFYFIHIYFKRKSKFLYNSVIRIYENFKKI